MGVQTRIEILRHSTAHLMAAAIQKLWPKAKFGVGPIVENGFYYDFEIEGSIEPENLQKIEEKMRELINAHLAYERKEMSLQDATSLFKELGQPYKVELLTDIKTRGTTKLDKEDMEAVGVGEPGTVSIYETGRFIDLCLGPHVATTRDINPKSFKLTKIAGAYWRGKETNPMLTRIYGVSFRTEKELTEYLVLQAEIEKRDHRKIGKDLDMFHFEDVSPGAAFWHPKGMIIVNELERFWREIHLEEDYLETSTPILVKKELFERSGHWEFFKESMFTAEIEKETYVLKPMNCPESALIYSFHIRSYRDLPLRLSEVGRVHRNEKSGVLLGLSRVRQITQDDAHIYARPDQIQDEIGKVLKLVKMFYKLFDLKPSFFLSTRPEKAMGDPKLWMKAEKALAFALKKSKLKYDLKSKEGAFYGPKIDIHVTDSLGREWQVATIQIDFQMPEGLDLSYTDEKGKKQRPVMIHRAIFGSFERFISIILEHFAGALPLWLSPVQVKVIPIGAGHIHYAEQIGKMLKENGIRVTVASENETVGKKIRNGELQKVPYVAVAGDREMKNKTVRIRSTRAPKGKEDLGEIKLGVFAKKVREEIEKKVIA